MNENTVEVGDLAVELYITKRQDEGCMCRKATEYEDMYLGFDVVVVKTDESVEYVDVKNRSHNICGILVLDTARFRGRKPFASGTLASHVYIANEDKQITIVEYFSEFVYDYNKIHLLRKIITELESVDFKATFASGRPKELVTKLMPYKKKFVDILKFPWELKFEEFCVLENRTTNKDQWYRMYYGEGKTPIIDYKANHITFSIQPSGKSSPITNEKIEAQTNFLSSALEKVLIKNKKDVS